MTEPHPTPEASLRERLMVALARYELDEPHWVDGPLSLDESADLTAEKLARWLASEHNGDCIGEPHTCARCLAEHWRHKADWIASLVAPPQTPAPRRPGASTTETKVAANAREEWRARQQWSEHGTPLGFIIETTRRPGRVKRGRGRPSVQLSRIGWVSVAWADVSEHEDNDSPESERVARLIAAAPSLLAALESALEALELIRSEDSWQAAMEQVDAATEQVRQAIQEARGT